MTDAHADEADAVAVDFLARLGSAMGAANYPIGLVRRTLTLASAHYGLTNQLLVLPNFVQYGGFDDTAGTKLRVVRAERDLRFDQTFPLAVLVERTERGEVSAEEGLAELDRIEALRPRFPPWVSVVGYAVESASFALILQPTLIALVAATGFGLIVGTLGLVGRLSSAVAQLLPTLSAFLVATIAFTIGRMLHLGEDSLRVLVPPLALFLPGVAITLAVIELTTREVVSGSARLIAGFMRLAQLAFGILIATQVTGVSAAELSVAPVNKFGAWAPWVGVALYAVGLMLYLGPPTRFFPWLLMILFAAYIGQFVTNLLFGSYASGFGGGFVLMVSAMLLSLRESTPPTAALLLPGFWLLVPGSIGLIGVTQLVSADSSAAVTVTLISMISIALGLQTGLLLWRAGAQLLGLSRGSSDGFDV
jgi:uncharacterized membrane protein YjjP (DUF1212 family)